MSTNFDLNPPPHPPHSQPHYSAPPVTVILTVILLVFFFTSIFSIYLCRYFMGQVINSSNSRRIPSRNAVQPTGSAGNGLEPSIIAMFPTVLYSSVKDLRQDKCGLECAVCLTEFEDNDELRVLTVCNHVFHPDCIDQWFGNHTTCPLCRRSLIPQEKSPENSVTAPPGNNDRQESEIREDSHEEFVLMVGGGDSHEGATSDAIIGIQGGGQHGDEEVVGRFSKSHSTGHSIIHVEPDLNDDRYTLRLPDHVKERIVRGHNWTGSCTTLGELSNNVGSRSCAAWLNCHGFPSAL